MKQREHAILVGTVEIVIAPSTGLTCTCIPMGRDIMLVDNLKGEGNLKRGEDYASIGSENEQQTSPLLNGAQE
jgi:hypothetical protein